MGVNIYHYNTILNNTAQSELKRFGLNWLDYTQDLFMLSDLSTYSISSIYLNKTLNLYLWSLGVNPLSIIEYRHDIKKYIHEIYKAKIKAQINNPVNNAVGWKV